MSSVDYDRYDDRRQRSHRHRDRDDREPRYVETQETYVRSPAPVVPDAPYTARTTEIIRRPVREDSDLSIEEVRRDFPPPSGYAQPRSDRYGQSHRSERDYGLDPRRSYNDVDDSRSRKNHFYAKEEVIKPRRRSLSRNQKIIAGVAGAALAVGGKEFWDRRQADSAGRPVTRNPLETAAVGAAGAFAGYEGAELYAKHGPGNDKAKVKTVVAHRGRNGDADAYYASDEDTVTPKRSKSRRKSIMEGALGLAGIGAAAKATSGGRDRDRDGRSRRGSRSSSRGGGREPEGAAKFQQAAKAALLAGATEAFRVRNEPGGWGGDKGKRILTAAIGAGGIDAAADRDPDKKSKAHILQAVVGGLAGNRLINGSRKDIDDDGRSIRSGRSRSRGARSRSRGPDGGSGPGAGLAALATAGLGALAGKKLLDRSRSRSRTGGDRDRRSRRYSSDYSRSPSPRRGENRDRHKRSKSVTDYARKGLAALGISGAAGAVAGSDRDRRDREVVGETTVRKSRRGGSDDGYGSRRSQYGDSTRDVAYAPSARGDVYGDPRYADSRSSVGRSSRKTRDRGHNRRVAEGRESPDDSDSSLGSSTDDEKKIRKMRAPRSSRY